MSSNLEIGIVLLGASDFKKSALFKSSNAFKNSYSLIKKALVNKYFVKSKKHRILDLFDKNHDPNQIDEIIRKYLQKEENQSLTDLILYYVGHGGFDQDRGFVLTLSGTKDDNIGISSLRFKDLSTRILNDAKNLRVYFILDCCFSSEAVFQSPIHDIIDKQFEDDFPESGTSLLCSSSRELPSLIVKEREITMFTEGLSLALTEGDNTYKNNYLTLKEIREVTFRCIRRLNPGKAVRPEVHSPRQPYGDIAESIRLFPNRSTLESESFSNPYDLKERADRIRLELYQNRFVNAIDWLLEFVREFSDSDDLLDEVIILSALSKDFDSRRGELNHQEYLEEKEKYYRKALDLLRKITANDVRQEVTQY